MDGYEAIKVLCRYCREGYFPVNGTHIYYNDTFQQDMVIDCPAEPIRQAMLKEK